MRTFQVLLSVVKVITRRAIPFVLGQVQTSEAIFTFGRRIIYVLITTFRDYVSWDSYVFVEFIKPFVYSRNRHVVSGNHSASSLTEGDVASN